MPGGGVGDFWWCGWRVRSALPLPGLLPWRGADRLPDIEITLGNVPAALADAVERGPFLEIGADGACLLAVERVGRYLVRDGRSVTIEPRIAPITPDVLTFLVGSVLGILCHQRGLLPLHASAVRLGSGAVALAGRSGAGKSTLALALAQRGHALLADDVSVIEAGDFQRPMMWPTTAPLRLWRDSLEAQGIATAGLARARAGLEKFFLPSEAGADPVPPAALPLRAIYALTPANPANPPGFSRMRGTRAMGTVADQIYRRRLGFRLGRQAALFAAASRVADTVPVYRLVRPIDIAALDDLARAVEAHVPE